MLGGNLSPDFSAILKLAGVEGGLENNLFRGRARVFDGQQTLLDMLDQTPEAFEDNDMIIVRYEGDQRQQSWPVPSAKVAGGPSRREGVARP